MGHLSFIGGRGRCSEHTRRVVWALYFLLEGEGSVSGSNEVMWGQAPSPSSPSLSLSLSPPRWEGGRGVFSSAASYKIFLFTRQTVASCLTGSSLVRAKGAMRC